MLRILLLSVLLIGPVHAFAVSFAVPDKDIWVYWDTEDKASKKVVDHSQWQSFIDKYVKYSDRYGMFMVEYGKVKKADKDNLRKYLNTLAVIDPRSLRKDEQLAYWINLYNALTVDLILKYYPVKSITKLGKGWFRIGPWKDGLLSINGKYISLHDIEHRILRPIWDKPEVHFALNCASIGCPDLAPEIYTAAGMESQLKRAGKRFVNQDKGVNFVGGRMVLSKIFEWYKGDFGGEKGVRRVLLEHARADLRKKIEAYKTRISYRYKWQLNEFKR